jgi:guanine deaminase
MITAMQHASIASKVLSFSDSRAPVGATGPSNSTRHENGDGHVHAHLTPASPRTSNHPTHTTTSDYMQSLASKQLPMSTLLYLATLGGAGVCCIQDKVGNFVQGKEFDAIVVDLGRTSGNPAMWYDEGDDLETLVERFLFGGDDRNIMEVYVCGRLIGGTSFKGCSYN